MKIFSAVLATLLLAGCAASNPIKPAMESRRPELVAFALEGSYTIVQGKALEFAQDPGTPQSARDVIARVDAKANPILDATKPLALEAAAVRKEVATCGGAPECSTKEDKLVALMKQLDGLIDEVAPLINDLLAAITGGAP